MQDNTENGVITEIKEHIIKALTKEDYKDCTKGGKNKFLEQRMLTE